VSDVASGNGRHRWVFDLLRRAGCRVWQEGEGVYAAQLADGLADRLGHEVLRFTFRKRLSGKDGVELAAPGSWVHDQLLRFAGDRGRVTTCFLAPRPELDRDLLLANRRRGFEERLELRERRYGTHFLFSFRLTLYAESPEETLVHVLFDAERGSVFGRPIARRTLLGGRADPEEGFSEAPPADLDRAFRRSWDALQDRVEAAVQGVRARARPAMDRELGTVERYYRDLIEEEKRLLKSRHTRRAQEENQRRIDHLKLEWERRVKEETERLEPSAVAHLSAVARIHVPLERWTCRIAGEGGGRVGDVWIDAARAEAWEATAEGG